MNTLHGMLAESAARFPQTRLEFGSRESITISGVRDAAEEFARGLRARGVESGDLIGILLPNCEDFVVSLFGISRAGSAAAPLALPRGLAEAALLADRIGRIAESSGMRVLITDARMAQRLADQDCNVQAVTRADLVLASRSATTLGEVSAESLAIVQYTSGSTSTPKGVTLTHANVLAGIEAIVQAMSLTHHDIHASWLPLFHDMGLCGLLSGLRAGTPQYLTSPAAFVKDPASWLEQFARRRASIYASPNFAYRLLLDRIDDETLKALDLSSWRVAFNGGEPIDAACMAEFIARFAVAGFRPATMVPCYGMAEATLAVTFDSFERAPAFETVARDTLGGEGVARQVSADAASHRRVVNVGRPVSGITIRISDESGQPCAERVVGEIEICGASVTSGYHENPEETRNRIRDGWLRTGDLGYLAEGCLYVTGRSKQMLIVRGTNYYPEDVEAAVRETQGIYQRRCVAVSPDATDQILVLAERSSTAPPDLESTIRRTAEIAFPELTFSVALVRARSLPQTSSGKFQRLLALELHRRGALGREHHPSSPTNEENPPSARNAVA